jgi:tRNA (cytosine38-C5)-methyltransferase
VEQLDILGYEIKEYLLTPTQFGIPNNRMRYYLTARKSKNYQNTTTNYIVTSKIQTEWPFGNKQIKESELPPLSQFLEEGNGDTEKLMVPERFILRLYKFRLDIVQPTDKHTSCITKVYLQQILKFFLSYFNLFYNKAYGSHHIQTSGSLVQTRDIEVLYV